MRRHVDVRANGNRDTDADEIVVGFYGPKGGVRAIESISVDNARGLAEKLMQAADALEAEVAAEVLRYQKAAVT